MLKVKTLPLMDWELISNTVVLHRTITPCPREIPVNAATPITAQK